MQLYRSLNDIRMLKRRWEKFNPIKRKQVMYNVCNLIDKQFTDKEMYDKLQEIDVAEMARREQASKLYKAKVDDYDKSRWTQDKQNLWDYINGPWTDDVIDGMVYHDSIKECVKNNDIDGANRIIDGSWGWDD